MATVRFLIDAMALAMIARPMALLAASPLPNLRRDPDLEIMPPRSNERFGDI
jgi:hypothetical protein